MFTLHTIVLQGYTNQLSGWVPGNEESENYFLMEIAGKKYSSGGGGGDDLSYEGCLQIVEVNIQTCCMPRNCSKTGFNQPEELFSELTREKGLLFRKSPVIVSVQVELASNWSEMLTGGFLLHWWN